MNRALGGVAVFCWGQHVNKKWTRSVVLWRVVGYTFYQVGKSGTRISANEIECRE